MRINFSENLRFIKNKCYGKEFFYSLDSFLSLESSYRDESNDINFIKIESLVVLNTGICRIIKF